MIGQRWRRSHSTQQNIEYDCGLSSKFTFLLRLTGQFDEIFINKLFSRSRLFKESVGVCVCVCVCVERERIILLFLPFN